MASDAPEHDGWNEEEENTEKDDVCEAKEDIFYILGTIDDLQNKMSEFDYAKEDIPSCVGLGLLYDTNEGTAMLSIDIHLSASQTTVSTDYGYSEECTQKSICISLQKHIDEVLSQLSDKAKQAVIDVINNNLVEQYLADFESQGQYDSKEGVKIAAGRLIEHIQSL